ncbi:MAG: hypothetical protein U1E45_15810 [Geminicoccaceae bacterium]
MPTERYPGERRGLALFIEDLLPLAERECGPDHLLVHAARRAVRSGDLDKLRQARQLFNQMPRDMRRRLSAGVVARTRRPPTREQLLDQYSRRQPVPVVAFEADGQTASNEPATVDLKHELLTDVPVRVLVRPGMLPTAVADQLRRIAGMIERDRRLLSGRYWGSDEPRDGGSQRDTS